MPERNRLLFASALSSIAGGVAAIGLGVAGWPARARVDAPGALSSLLVFAGFLTALVGAYGLITWYALSRPDPAGPYVALADAYAAAGKVEYARTFYEEAIRWGADPVEVEGRLALCEARARRAATHREPL